MAAIKKAGAKRKEHVIYHRKGMDGLQVGILRECHLKTKGGTDVIVCAITRWKMPETGASKAVTELFQSFDVEGCTDDIEKHLIEIGVEVDSCRTLQDELNAAVVREDYERAAVLRDRIERVSASLRASVIENRN